MFYILILVLIILDQGIKLIINKQMVYGQSIPVINNIFHITYVRNTGAGFGILQGQRVLFIILTAVIVIFMLIYRYKVERNIFLDAAFILVIGGAIGNLIDRIRLHYVIDYLDFRIWPVFNLADSAVVVGVGLLIIYLWKLDSTSTAKNNLIKESKYTSTTGDNTESGKDSLKDDKHV